MSKTPSKKNADAAELLQELGLTEYEARAYVAVLAQPGGPAAAIARAAAIPRPRIYDILDRLSRRGFVVRTGGRRTSYHAVPTDQILSQLRYEEETRRARNDDAAEKLQSILDRIIGDSAEDPAGAQYFQVIKSPMLQLVHENRLWQNATSRIVACAKAPYIMPRMPHKMLDEAAAITIDALERGVTWKTVFEASDASELSDCKPIAYFMARGEKVRFTPSLPMKMAVFDGRDCVIHLEEPGTGTPAITCLFISHRGLGEVLEAYFNQLWAKATPLRIRKGRKNPSDDERWEVS
ncbi:MAG: helix-turn-helix domain-containing protein [Candidatus Zixiibacteriota bacterium]|jgi:sugar-specific transcriptional regulator TrmB